MKVKKKGRGLAYSPTFAIELGTNCSPGLVKNVQRREKVGGNNCKEKSAGVKSSTSRSGVNIERYDV